jgi:hypothetical protein
MTAASRRAYRSPMKATGAADRPGLGWLGLVPPGWPSDVAVALVVGAAQLVFSSSAA